MSPSTLQQQIAGVYTWGFHHQEWKVDFTSTLFISKERAILIDPVAVTAAITTEITKLGTPVAILLTSGTHERESHAISKELKIPVGASPLAHDEIGFTPDLVLIPGTSIYELSVLDMPGTGSGEIAIHHAPSRTLILGDSILNYGADRGLELLPEKYRKDSGTFLQTIRNLLRLDFVNLFMAHGSPIIGSAKEQIQKILP